MWFIVDRKKVMGEDWKKKREQFYLVEAANRQCHRITSFEIL
jgi:hypothetical protein